MNRQPSFRQRLRPQHRLGHLYKTLRYCFIKPASSYLICATHRSGSSLLAEAMRQTSIAGRPTEYFQAGSDRHQRAKKRGASAYARFLAKVIVEGTTSNGVFGAKIMWTHFDIFIKYVQQIPKYKILNMCEVDLISTVFPNLHYIWITRLDKVRQAVSLDKAVQTGIWSWRSDEPPVLDKQPIFDFERINMHYQRLVDYDEAWQQYFATHGIRPFKVVYEEFVATYDQTTKAILDYLKIPVPEGLKFGDRLLRKQADALNEEWVQRFHELKGQCAADPIRM